MTYEDVFEPIEVITHFNHGQITPVKFKWKEKVYKVSKVNGGWISDEGMNRSYHFSVMSEGPDCFEITFDSNGMTWELTKVCMDG